MPRALSSFAAHSSAKNQHVQASSSNVIMTCAILSDARILDLNNQGILLLDEGKYENAAKLFKSAFEVVKKFTEQRALSLSESTPTMQSPKSDVPTSSTRPKLASAGNSMGQKRPYLVAAAAKNDSLGTVNSQRRKRKTRLEEDTDIRVKRQRTETTAENGVEGTRSSTPRPCSGHSVLGRPLWLDYPKQKCGNLLSLYAASTLYNFAYALHRIGTDMNEDDNSRRKKIFQQAIAVYQKAIRLSLRRECGVVLWVCCHNLQILMLDPNTGAVPLTEESEPYRALETHKVNVLRSMAKSSRRRSVGKAGLLVLAMLGVCKPCQGMGILASAA